VETARQWWFGHALQGRIIAVKVAWWLGRAVMMALLGGWTGNRRLGREIKLKYEANGEGKHGACLNSQADWPCS
jgi:hypothetical protein